jgi:TfoX/Sxy family transcriptional regulator of competence genes
MGSKSRDRAPLNEELLSLVRRTIGPREDILEKRMFGGVAFLLDGKMTCGVSGNDLMIRVAPEDFEAGLAAPHTRPMDFTGRPLRGFLYLARSGWENAKIRKKWVLGSIEFAASLPAKKPRKPRPRVRQR